MLLLLAIAAACFSIVLLNNRSRKRLPPSPPGIPLFGNIFQIPRVAQHVKFLEWARQYGDMYTLRVGWQTIIVVNSAEAADELLVKRAKNYSSRPYSPMASEALSDGQRVVLMPYNEEWKAARKGITSAVGAGAMKRVRLLQELESRTLLYDLMNHGDRTIQESKLIQPGPGSHVPHDHWFYLLRRFVGSVIMNIMYAERVHQLHGTPHIDKICEIISNFLRVVQPGQYLVDAFPFLRFLPAWIARYKIEGKSMHLWEWDTFGSLLEEHKANVKGGMTRECFISSYLRARADNGHEDAPGVGITSTGWMRDKLLAYSAGSLLEASMDTTTSTIETFLLYMLSNPEALRKAREEVDRIVGSERMPIWEDEVNLPYLIACIKESIRIRPVATLGFPHTVDADDEYKGYFIPKGSTIIGNVYAIHTDPVRYPDPHIFKPERFYEPGQPTMWRSGPESKNRDHYIFGWGRRYCAGSLFAESSLFIVCARMIWGLDMTPPTNPSTGNPALPDVNDEESWSGETINGPKIFSVAWKVRDRQREEVIRRAFEEAQREWQLLGLEQDVR